MLLFALIAGAFSGEPPRENLFRGLTDGQWTQLFRDSAAQGVMSLAWEGVQRLPAELQPPRAVRMNWALNAERSEQQQHHRKETALETVALFAQNDIRTVILKGISLDGLYPDPALRESCDVDIYLPDTFEKGNELLAKQPTGKVIDRSNPKHTVLQYKGVVFENHRTLLDVVDRAGLQRSIEAVIRAEIERQSFVPQEGGFYTLPPCANALFLLRHMSRHFIYGELNLRQVLDYGLFLRAYDFQIDPAHWNDLLTRTGLATISSLYLQIFDAVMAPSVIDLRSSSSLRGIVRKRISAPASFIGCEGGKPEAIKDLSPAADRILADMLSNGRRPSRPGGFAAKLCDRLGRRWRYRLLPDTLLDDAVGSWLRRKFR